MPHYGETNRLEKIANRKIFGQREEARPLVRQAIHLLAVALIATPLSLRADTVILRDGTIYRGVRTRIQGKKLEIYGKERILIPLVEIRTIIPESVDPKSIREPAEAESRKNGGPEGADFTGDGKSSGNPPQPVEAGSGDRKGGAGHPEPLFVFHRPTVNEFVAGPVPGWSPNFEHDRIGLGILLGGAEILSLAMLLPMMVTPETPGLSRYLGWSLVTANLTTGAGPQWISEYLRTAIVQAVAFREMDRIMNDPVHCPFESDRLVPRHQFQANRRKAALLFLSFMLIDTFTAFVGEPGHTVSSPPAPPDGFTSRPQILLVTGSRGEGDFRGLAFRWRF